MIDIKMKIQGLLFARGGSVKVSKLAEILEIKVNEVKECLEDLMNEMNVEGSGIHIIDNDGEVEMVTNPEISDLIIEEEKREVQSELTKPQLETLTVIAYKGPISRAELEHIRGVNCQVVLRNLGMRGLIDDYFDDNILQTRYNVSGEFLKMLGLHRLEDLPRYEEFNSDEHLNNLLDDLVMGD